MKKSRLVAFCGILSALGVVFLLLGSILNVMDISMAILASILLFVAFEEIKYSSLFVYFTTLVVSAITCYFFDPLVVVIYATFGIFPIIKKLTEKLGRVGGMIVRVIYALLASALTVVFMRFVFLSEEMWWFDVIYFVANVTIFILFDVAIAKFSQLYQSKLRSKLHIDKFFDK